MLVVVLALAASIAAGVVGLVLLTDRMPGDAKRVLQNAEQLELYSIAPGRPLSGTSASGDGETIHEYLVLGKTVITDANTKRLVVDAVLKGVNEGNKAAMCFNPRHALRATAHGKTVDLVICFECYQLKVFVGDEEKNELIMTSESPEPVLDQVLTDAGVKLAPKAKK
jgi:hypothetical protein